MTVTTTYTKNLTVPVLGDHVPLRGARGRSDGSRRQYDGYPIAPHKQLPPASPDDRSADIHIQATQSQPPFHNDVVGPPSGSRVPDHRPGPPARGRQNRTC
jgi:hypothetical protein